MHQFQLQPYKGPQSRYTCPNCDKTRSFTRYIDTHTGAQVAPHVGMCNRKDKCGYHYSPKRFFELGNLAAVYRAPIPKAKKQPPKTDYYIHPSHVNSTFTDYRQNNFVHYLESRFGFDVAEKLIGMYRIGTSGHWFGATVFWQIDTHGHVRTGKIMLYNKQTGKRIKQPFNHITWAHTLLSKQLAVGSGQFTVSGKQWAVSRGRLADSSTQAAVSSGHFGNGSMQGTANCPPQTADFILNQCLFGEHLLLTSPYKPVAIVESEKTAIIAAAMMPAFIWLSCGSLEGLNLNKCAILQNREVMLFPDVNAIKKWQQKATELSRQMKGTRFVVSDYLEKLATDKDRKTGVDIGDVVYG